MKSLCGVVAAMVAVSTSAMAQQAPSGLVNHTGDDVAKVMVLDVAVTNKKGVPVAGLQASDLALSDNKAPLTITSFRAGDDTEPMKVILVVDSVNASFQTIAYEKDQIETFLRANEGRLAAPTTLVILTDKEATIMPGFTQDGHALSATLDQYEARLHTITRSMGVYGAEERFQLSIHALQQLLSREAKEPGRKVVLWISPGWPLLSGGNIELDKKEENSVFSKVTQLTTQLRNGRFTLYAVNPLGVEEDLARETYYKSFLKAAAKPAETDYADLSLQVLAAQSGGLVESSTGIAAVLQQCVDDARGAYEVTFAMAPGDAANAYHHLEVKVDRPGVTARTADGYYAPAQ